MSTAETPTRAQPAPLPAGGQVLAVVPQTVEEIQRMSNMVIAAGIAPQSLIKRVKDDAEESEKKLATQMNIAAVATAIMAGAELGLPPFVALRSFTVINGRPALYADGNVAVVRKAKDREGNPICEYVRHGFQVGETEALTFAWCEARRRDNGEVHREEFSIEDAKLAGLWDAEPMREREVWEYVQAERKRMPVKRLLPNDTPWHRFPKRMMMWRATGYCLRWLFADVLGGMPDEYEARDIEGLIDITPQPRQAERVQPPPVPEDEGDETQAQPDKPKDPEPPKPKATRKPKADVAQTAGPVEIVQEDAGATAAANNARTVVENTATGAAMVIDGDGQVIEEDEPDPAPPETSTTDQGEPPEGFKTWDGWWELISYEAERAGEQDALDEVFGERDVYSILSGDEAGTERANGIYDTAKARIAAGITADRQRLEADGQGSLIDELPDETVQAVRLGNTP